MKALEAPKPDTKSDKVLAPKSVAEFYRRWLDSASRYQMAQQTLQGAQAAVQEAELRLKGILEYLYGPDYSFEWDDKKQLLLVDPKGNLKSDAPKEMTQAQLNRAARRALKRVQ